MTTEPTRIILVRHGHVHNPEDIIYGRLPGFGLSDVGQAQVEAAARALYAVPLTAIYTSPQLRAIQTAKIIAHYHPDIPITVAPLVDEIQTHFEGRPSEEVAARGWDLYTGAGPGFEAPPDIAARAGRLVNDVRQQHEGETVAVATHGDVIAFTVLWAMREPVRVSLKRTLDRFGVTDHYPATGSLTTLVYPAGEPEAIPQVEYLRPYGKDLLLPSLS